MTQSEDGLNGLGQLGWVRNTLLYREWERTREEILDHKWYESERAGHDIGWERAAIDYQVRFGSRRARCATRE